MLVDVGLTWRVSPYVREGRAEPQSQPGKAFSLERPLQETETQEN